MSDDVLFSGPLTDDLLADMAKAAGDKQENAVVHLLATDLVPAFEKWWDAERQAGTKPMDVLVATLQIAVNLVGSVSPSLPDDLIDDYCDVTSRAFAAMLKRHQRERNRYASESDAE